MSERRLGRLKGGYAVSLETGITYSDWNRMHMYRRRDQRERKMETPLWAIRDGLLRELLVIYLEHRFFLRAMPSLSLLERLERARHAALYYAPYKRELLRKLIVEHKKFNEGGLDAVADDVIIWQYAQMPEMGGQLPIGAEYARWYMNSKNIKSLEILIQNLDTDLVLTQRGHAEVIASVVYLYYRMGWDSVEIAEHLSLKPPHIRQVLARLHGTWLSHYAETSGALSRDAMSEPDSVGAFAGHTLDAPFSFIWDEKYVDKDF